MSVLCQNKENLAIGSKLFNHVKKMEYFCQNRKRLLLLEESIQYRKKTGIFFNLKFQNISMDTLTRYNVRIHTDTYDQVAILYPR